MNIKEKIHLLMLSISALFWSCGKSVDDTLLVTSQSEFTVESSATTVSLEVASTAAWSITSNMPEWCNPSTTTGLEKKTVYINVSANDGFAARTASLYITSGNIKRTVKVTQMANKQVEPETYIYKLPVIFHVLYADKSNSTQHPKASRFKEIINQCNKLYQNRSNGNSTNMNLEFVLAANSPTGERLEQPGVQYVPWHGSTMDYNSFMKDRNSTNKNLLWSQDRYINIVVYTFTEKSVLGVSHLPYTMEGNQLEGLSTLNYKVQPDNLSYPHCISLNNTYIHTIPDPGYYSPFDPIVTLAHELGHYLGLFHTFSEMGDDYNSCADTDFCDDTPTYNKFAYDDWVQDYFYKNPTDPQLQALVKRVACDGTNFTSYNLMDYSYSYSNQFTPDQAKRVRHVLYYSPLIPGPKRETGTRSLTVEGVQELPVRIMK